MLWSRVHAPRSRAHGPWPSVNGPWPSVRGAKIERGLFWKGPDLEGACSGRGFYEKVEKMNFENWNKDDGRGFWKGTLTKIKM